MLSDTSVPVRRHRFKQIGPQPRYTQLDENGKPISSGTGGWVNRCMIAGIVIFVFASIAALVVGGIALNNTNKPVMPEMPLMLDDPPVSKRAPVTQTVLPSPGTIVLSATSSVYTLRVPTDLTNYLGKTYAVYSNTSLAHKIVFTSAVNSNPNKCPRTVGPTFDEDGLYPVALFTNKKGCFVQWQVVECGKVMVQASQCVDWCTANLATCVHPSKDVNAPWASIQAGAAVNFTVTNSLNVTGTVTTNAVCSSTLAHIANGILPSTHSKQTVANPPSVTPVSVPQLTNAPLGGFSTYVVGGDLRFKVVSGNPWLVRDLAADDYKSISDSAGTRVIQIGDPNDWTGVSSGPAFDPASPIDNTISKLDIFSNVFGNGIITINLRYSTEVNFDFVRVSKNGVGLFSDSGAGPSASDGFVENTITTSLLSSDVISVSFEKDSGFWGGYDVVYLHVSLAPRPKVDLSLPANLTTYIGKEIEVCSLDDGLHTLSAPAPLHFDPAGFWQTIQFQGNGANGCCVKFSVLSQTQLSILSRNPCTLFCANPDLYHCVDPLRPYETSAFHGWWKQTSKNFNGNPYMFVDMSQSPINVKLLTGTVEHPVETQTTTTALVGVGQGTFTLNGETNLIDPGSSVSTIQFQPGAQELIFDNLKETLNTGFGINFGVFEKSATAPVVKNLFDPEDPVSILRNFFEIFTLDTYSGVATALSDNNWPGYFEAKASLEEIISVGKTHANQAIVKTLVTHPLNPENLTEFRTENYHHVSASSKVTISGFIGSCAFMNGVHLVVPAGTENHPDPDPLFQDYGSNSSARTVHHRVTVHLDSTAAPVFPNTNTANCTGSVPLLSVSYGPITSVSNYLETMGALLYWVYENPKVVLHTIPKLYYDLATRDPRSRLARQRVEWAEVIADLSNGAEFIQRQATRFYGPTSVFFTNAGLKSLRSRLYEGFTSTTRSAARYSDLTGRFGIRPDLDARFQVYPYDNVERGTFWFDIGPHNYMENVAYPAWKTIGTSRSHPLNLVAQAAYPGGNGDEFHSIMVPMGELPPVDYSYMTGYIAGPNGGAGFPYDFDYNFANAMFQRDVFVGKIKSSLSGGENIGYIRIDHEVIGDSFGFGENAEFCPTGFCTGPRRNREATVSMFATFMEYLLVNLTCDHVIVDIRGNLGGNPHIITSIADLFGSDDRLVLDSTHSVRADNGFGPLVKLDTYMYPNNRITQAQNAYTAYPSITAANYPNSILTNGQLVILTDQAAASAGDIFPNVFGGLSLNGTLGSNTQMTLLGSVDGRGDGFACGRSMPYSQTSPRLKDASGAPVSPLVTNLDCNGVFLRPDGTSMTNRHPLLEIDPSPTLTGKSGSNALPQDWEELVYKDLGFTTNDRAVLSGWTGPQTPTVIAETNPLSTVNGSNVVTVTTSSPHGFATGDSVALGTGVDPVADTSGIPGDALTGGHIITVTSSTTFTFEATLDATYPGFLPTPADTTATGVGGTIRIINRSQWRDAWLEQAIRKIIALGKKKRSSPLLRKNPAKTTTRKVGKFNPRVAREIYGRDVVCPQGVTLSHLNDMHATQNITVDTSTSVDNFLEHQQKMSSAIDVVKNNIVSELQSGGMCLDNDGKLMATPTCKQMIKIVLVQPKLEPTGSSKKRKAIRRKK